MAARRTKKARALKPNISTAPPLPALLANANWQALLSLVVANAFEELKVGVSLWMTGDWSYPVNTVEGQGVLAFEYAFGVGARRWAYNSRCLDRLLEERRVVRGEHAGFSDLFVPIQSGRDLHGVLVAGPFATAWPSSADILSRWSDISGSQGRLTDPTFSHYVSTTLETLTLPPPLPAAFERLMSCLASLVAGRGSLESMGAEATALRQELVQARFAERMWDVARLMLDERTATNWASHSHGDMAALGLDARRGHEDRADDQEHRKLVLPVGRQMEEIPAGDAVGENAGGRHQRHRGDDLDQPIDALENARERAGGVLSGHRRGFGLDGVEAVQHRGTSAPSGKVRRRGPPRPA